MSRSVGRHAIRILPALLLFLISGHVTAQTGAPLKTVDEGGGITQFEYDTNNDGKVDLVVRLDASGRKVSESADYNHDGKMDDFYAYHKGVLLSRKVDTNFDGKVDLWVWLTDGIYVSKYERDLNHDGKPDLVKVFEKQSSPQQETNAK